MSRSTKKAACVSTRYRPGRILRKRVKQALHRGDDLMPVAGEVTDEFSYDDSWAFWGRFEPRWADAMWSMVRK